MVSDHIIKSSEIFYEEKNLNTIWEMGSKQFMGIITPINCFAMVNELNHNNHFTILGNIVNRYSTVQLKY